MTSSLAEQYRELRRAQSASMIYQEPAAPAPRPTVYTESTYGGLGQYSGRQADPLARMHGESFEAYERRLRSVGRHLPDGEIEARLEAVTSAASEQQWTWEAHRAQVDNRTGTGTGIMGNLTPQERGAVVGSRFGGREVQAQGYLASRVESTGAAPRSNVEVHAMLREEEAARQAAWHTRTASLRSSGTGWTGASNG